MGDLFRSDHMTQCDVYLQPESAYEILSQLGELGIVQFNDMNVDLNAFQRNYVTEVLRCAEMERKLRYMEAEMLKDNIVIFEPSKIPPAPPVSEMLLFEGVIELWHSELEEATLNERTLKKNYLELMEMYYVLTQIGPILGDTDQRRESILKVSRALGEAGQLIILTGVVKRSKCFNFEIMLWRTARGNVYYRQALQDETLEDPQTGQGIRKVAFLVVCQGASLESRMKKVCSGFRANLYQCPFSLDEREDMIDKLADRLYDLNQVMAKTKLLRRKILKTISKQWMHWKVSIKKMKAIFHTMNLFNVDVTKKVLIGLCWVPTRDLPAVRKVLEDNTDASTNQLTSFMSKVDTDEEPPTYNRTNKFTKAFQVLISAYGDATYQEVNPALYTIITFPFLFALMFGDVGHAFIMAAFAAWMVVYEDYLEPSSRKNEVWGIFFGGRYIMLLMGLFSIYTGLIYNDLFSKAMNLFGSHWQNTFSEGTISVFHYLTLDPRTATTDSLYFLGIDPVWNMAKNKILFENSLKMKFSIIIGVLHMIFGVCLSVINHIHFRRRYSIILEFIPQVLFLILIFLYLVFMIYFKWFNYSGEATDPVQHSGCAPLVLLLFIDMMLVSESQPVEDDCPAYMYDNQQKIQLGLLITALCCVPVILFGKPVYLYFKKRKEQVPDATKTDFRRWQRDSLRKDSVPKKELEDDSFSELMIHQGVHTIEYVLSTISHTASYLRLWALSLAHSQLSEMLWVMVLSKNGLRHYGPTGFIPLVVAFAVWATFTITILVVMEGLSAFLHTLRLHWVEFMSKFFIGTGYGFQPFCFKDILSSVDKDEKLDVKKK